MYQFSALRFQYFEYFVQHILIVIHVDYDVVISHERLSNSILMIILSLEKVLLEFEIIISNIGSIVFSTSHESQK